MKKYGQPRYDRRGILRLYKNGIEVRCARYTDVKRRVRLIEMWKSELIRLKEFSKFHISIEPETKP